jgi:hypothetical protein
MAGGVAMAQSDLEKLEQLDIMRLTVGDVMSLKNTVMRRALIEVIMGIAKPNEHYSHGAHSNHYKTMAIRPTFENPVVDQT